MKKIFLFAMLFVSTCHAEPLLQLAQQQYLLAESEQDPLKKQKNYNDALRIYAELTHEHQPEFGNGKLYYNLANSFYQLGEYPYAFFYYNKALSLSPGDQNIAFNLKAVKEQMGQMPVKERASFSEILLMEFLPLPLRLQLFSLFCILFFVFWSLLLWFQKSLYKYAALLFFVVGSFFFLSVMHTRYFTPIKAVMVHASSLYKGAGEQYGKVSKEILFSGSTVQVLDAGNQGKWLKILTEEGTLGYVPSSSLKMI